MDGAGEVIHERFLTLTVLTGGYKAADKPMISLTFSELTTRIAMPNVDNDIKKLWFTAGTNRIWPTSGTYTRIPFNKLPPLPSADNSFSWLSQTGAERYQYGCTLDSDDNKLDSLAAIEAELSQLGLQLPTDFSRFIRSPAIYGRIPSCTACYLELSDHVTPLAGFPDHYVLRFMNDSQCCVLWYLLFQPDAQVRVLASSYFIEKDIFDAMEYYQDEDVLIDYASVTEDAVICANSFGEFIFRFGIENMIWYALHENLDLTPLETRYIEDARKLSDA